MTLPSRMGRWLMPCAAVPFYLVSCHTNVGHYAATTNHFGSAVVNGPLTAPANGSSGGNGVYLCGAGRFPTQTFNASNCNY
jgi:hypothetical protein